MPVRKDELATSVAAATPASTSYKVPVGEVGVVNTLSMDITLEGFFATYADTICVVCGSEYGKSELALHAHAVRMGVSCLHL